MSSQINVELLVLFTVLNIQVYFFILTIKGLKKLKHFFPVNQLDEDFIEKFQINKESLLLLRNDDDYNPEFKSVIISINKYLTKNRGVTDFNILKSIIERKLDLLENEGTVNISLPLYVGLMGTFSGIVLGLLKLAYKDGVNEQNIAGLIGGVELAMIGSFVGLLLTVINNSYHLKKAKSVSDNSKNNFYDTLQIELLPHLENGMYDALDRLKNNISDFNQKFEVNIKLFDTKFATNISSLKTTVELLSENMGAVIENTKTQQEFLIDLKKVGYNKMAEANLRVFSLLNEALPTLHIFIEKQKDLNKSVDNAALVVQTINNIMIRVGTFEKSINDLGDNINTKQYLGNEVLKRIDTNLTYLDKQYELLKRHEITSSLEIETHFTKQFRTIEVLTSNIKKSVEEALTINIKENPFQKLLLLESLDTQLKNIHESIDQREVLLKESNTSIQNSIMQINNKIDLKDKDIINRSDLMQSSITTILNKIESKRLNKIPQIKNVVIKASITERKGIKAWFFKRSKKL